MPKIKKSLSPEEIQEYKECFEMFDEDGDCMISQLELGHMMERLGQKPNGAELQAMMTSVDTDGNGLIDFNEFCTLMMNYGSKENIKEELMAAFKAIDTDASGALSKDEIKSICVKFQVNITDEEVDELIRDIDLDGNGQIDYEEFSEKLMEGF